MGYWAKDGSYVRDEFDDQPTMSERERWEHDDRIAARRQQQEADRVRQEDAERDFRNSVREMDKEILKKNLAKEAEVRKKGEDLRYEEDPMLWLRNPRDLDERRARANYWRLNSKWSVLISKINGKGKKFEALWDQYSHAETEEERAMIVEQMEKLYPTTKARLEAAEKKEGRVR